MDGYQEVSRKGDGLDTEGKKGSERTIKAHVER